MSGPFSGQYAYLETQNIKLSAIKKGRTIAISTEHVKRSVSPNVLPDLETYP